MLNLILNKPASDWHTPSNTTTTTKVLHIRIAERKEKKRNTPSSSFSIWSDFSTLSIFYGVMQSNILSLSLSHLSEVIFVLPTRQFTKCESPRHRKDLFLFFFLTKKKKSWSGCVKRKVLNVLYQLAQSDTPPLRYLIHKFLFSIWFHHPAWKCNITTTGYIHIFFKKFG